MVSFAEGNLFSHNESLLNNIKITSCEFLFLSKAKTNRNSTTTTKQTRANHIVFWLCPAQSFVHSGYAFKMLIHFDQIVSHSS